MFFVDKYAPKKVKDAFFHKEELNKLKTMSKDDAIPHIIFYGPSGCGKKTTINIFLEMLYDEEVHNLVNSVYNVTGSGNNSTQVTIKQSNYHIVIEPNNNNFDRYLIQDVVKEYAKRVPLGVFTSQKFFKTVLINNIDNLSYYAQTSLRRTLEKYSGTCRFIMWSRSLSKVISPLRSRCYCFGIKSPSNSDLFEYLLNISAYENISLTLEEYTEILNRSNNNIKTALWYLELSKFGEDFETTYDETIKKITKLILDHKLESLPVIRELIYNIMITNITGTKIIKDITNSLLSNKCIPFESKINIVEIAAEKENNLIKGRREIMHLEPFITGIMKELYYNEKYQTNKKNVKKISTK